MMTSMMQLSVIALFYLAILATGVWASRLEKAGADQNDTSDLMLGGRKLPFIVGLFTMTATWVGGGYINGTAEAVYDKARGLLWAQAPWCYALSLILGGLLFAGIMRRHGFTTMLDPFDRRYGKRMATLFFLPALVGEIFWSAAILTALGTTFGTILNYDFQTSIVLSAAIAIGYTMLGGLMAVAYTDVIQLIFILIGLVIALPFALAHSGDFSTLYSRYQLAVGPSASLLPFAVKDVPLWVWLDGAFLLILGGIPWQVYFQRVLASPDERTARNMSLAAAIGCILLAIPAVLIGMIAVTADWAAAGKPMPPDAAIVLPWVLHQLTPPLIATIGLGAVAAAVMSSVDSSILSASSMFVWNVYRPMFRPDADAREISRTTRWSILVTGTLATLLALQVRSVYALWYLCSDCVYVILFPQLVMALWYRRATLQGALAGFCIALILRIASGEVLLGLPSLLPWPALADGTITVPFRSITMLSSLLTIFLVSHFTCSRWPSGSLTKITASDE